MQNETDIQLIFHIILCMDTITNDNNLIGKD